jgi:hypothetical protein
LDLPKLEC